MVVWGSKTEGGGGYNPLSYKEAYPTRSQTLLLTFESRFSNKSNKEARNGGKAI